MAENRGQYSLFLEFVKAYSRMGFKGIDRNDPLTVELEEMMDGNNQYLSVFDVLRMKTEFVSLGSLKMLGVKPDDLTAYHFKEATHPEDLKRQELGLVQLFRVAHELFVVKKGEMLLSSNFRLRVPGGNYTDQIVQCYFFYSPDPNNTVYLLNIKTDISRIRRKKHGFHYYLGNDLSYFRYPDEELLKVGNIFSDREFEIIRLVQKGFDSEQIAEKLFLSRHTVNTHRKNILEKTGKDHLSDVIFDLQEKGML